MEHTIDQLEDFDHNLLDMDCPTAEAAAEAAAWVVAGVVAVRNLDRS
jgi:hypothetical protein